MRASCGLCLKLFTLKWLQEPNINFLTSLLIFLSVQCTDLTIITFQCSSYWIANTWRQEEYSILSIYTLFLSKIINPFIDCPLLPEPINFNIYSCTFYNLCVFPVYFFHNSPLTNDPLTRMYSSFESVNDQVTFFLGSIIGFKQSLSEITNSCSYAILHCMQRYIVINSLILPFVIVIVFYCILFDYVLLCL